MVFFPKNWDDLIENLSSICNSDLVYLNEPTENKNVSLIDIATALCQYLKVHNHKLPGSVTFHNETIHLNWVYGRKIINNDRALCSENKVITASFKNNEALVEEIYINIETNECKQLKIENFESFNNHFLYQE